MRVCRQLVTARVEISHSAKGNSTMGQLTLRLDSDDYRWPGAAMSRCNPYYPIARVSGQSWSEPRWAMVSWRTLVRFQRASRPHHHFKRLAIVHVAVTSGNTIEVHDGIEYTSGLNAS